MKNTVRISGVILLIQSIFLIHSCELIDDNSTKDFDGNVYKTVTIGTQVWMAENLKTTHYRNGDLIPNITDDVLWIRSQAGAYCHYLNNVANVAVYGELYNWYTVADSRNICPTGWHVPTETEFSTLITYLGGGAIAGGKLKEAGTTHWLSPNVGATNETGFAALPGGYRAATFTTFTNIGSYGVWWSSTKDGNDGAKDLIMGCNDGTAVIGSYSAYVGYSVRCLKDK